MAQSLMKRMRQVLGASRARSLSAVGVLAAGLLLSEVNLLSAREFVRFDLSPSQTFSVSVPTATLLAGLEQDVQLTVLLGADSPFRVELKYLLENYRAQSPRLTVKTVDPDQAPAEYMDVMRRISSVSLAESTGYAQPVVLVESEGRKWVIDEQKLSRADDNGGQESTVEQSLSEAIAQVTSTRKDVVCFVTGHGEASMDDTSPDGLAQLEQALSRTNIDARRLPLDVVDPTANIEACDLLAVVGPTRTFPRSDAELLFKYAEQGRHVLLLLDPLVDQDGSMKPSGLETLAQQVGVILEPNFVVESDPALRTPRGIGESFFAVPQTHPITKGLSTESDRLDARVLLVATQALRAVPGSGAQALLSTSAQASALSEMDARHQPTGPRARLILAYAQEQPLDNAGNRRSVVVGTSNIARNEALADPAQFGNRIFLENAVAWLLKRDALISIPSRMHARAGVRLTEESLSALLRYVLVYLPCSAAGLGVWVVLRRNRRTAEAQQREAASTS